jgi:hypothetical protein
LLTTVRNRALAGGQTLGDNLRGLLGFLVENGREELIKLVGWVAPL